MLESFSQDFSLKFDCSVLTKLSHASKWIFKDDGYELRMVADKNHIQNCPAIEADPNQQEISCNDYYCRRKCKNGFRSVRPMKVFCKNNDAGEGIWVDKKGQATLGGCQSTVTVIPTDTVITDAGIIHRFWD